MEQRIGSSSKPTEAAEPLKGEPLKGEPLKVEPVLGAGFDPAFVPGITGPTPAGGVTKSPEPVSEAAAPAEDSAQPPSSERASPEPVSSERVDTEEADAEDAEDKGDGPVFEASDRRAKIVADRRGVRLSLDEEACEFRWDEIAAVETESPRFGKRYTITVHTPDRRWYPIEIEATARARFKEWDEQLDAVLDAYFEEA
ncbi:hypothetical protein ACIP4Y_15305 [Streptomyces sp. NPDC088810]|uniref:hypothetical protein n=1 Tax=Streptomyces sp. NPDC088810 TaxID=3365904 RepID=UPI0037FB30EB